MTDETRTDDIPPADAGPLSAGSAPSEAVTAEAPRTKACVFCLSEIDSRALRCNRCAGYLPPAEGTDFKQHWTMLFACLSLFLAAVLLPLEGGILDLFARHSKAGAFLVVFSAYGVLASYANIFQRKMIMWPAFFAALDALYIVVSRGMQIVHRTPKDADFRTWVDQFGPGYYVMVFGALLVLWTLLRGVMAGAKREAERKEAAKAMRKR